VYYVLEKTANWLSLFWCSSHNRYTAGSRSVNVWGTYKP